MSQRSSSRARPRQRAVGVGETCRRSAARPCPPLGSWSGLLLCVSFAVPACVPREREGGQGASQKPAPVKVEAEPAAEVTQVAKALPVVKSSELPPAADDEEDAVLAATFVDDFERQELGPDWRATSPAWRISAGRLCVSNAKNHPAWLKRRLPLNAQVEFDAISSSPDGDIKSEIWGDGRSAAAGTSYDDATSYIAVFGGWRNQFHVLARLDEHASDRKQRELVADTNDFKRLRVNADQLYHFKLERRDGKTLRWWVDDIEILAYADPKPLSGPGHEHFGFNDWQVRVCFDNLRASPVKG
jgi:hypothetical protein